ncbi:MAG: glutamine synthetase, partial [Thermomicrobiales bacterium]
TLGEAVEELQKDEVVQAALGDHVYERLVEGQTSEWNAFRQHVSQWERDRYLEIY